VKELGKGKKLHLLLSGDFPPVMGGESRFLYNLFYYLPTLNKAVVAPYLRGFRGVDNSMPFYVKRLPIRSKGPLKLISLLLYFWSIFPFKEKKLLIHCGQVMIPGMAGLLAKYLLGVPYIVYAYGAELLKYVHIPHSAILKAVFKNADKVITISNYTTSQVKKLGIPEDKIIRTLLGVDVDEFYPSPPNARVIKRYGFEGKKVIMTTCRLVDHKGIDMVISALPRILKEVRDVTYLVVGSGEDRARLENIACEKGVRDKVLFAGNVSDEDLMEFYNLSDLFVMATREVSRKVDGFGITFIEANACGRPVIGGRSGGVGDAIIDGVTGLLVDPEDIDEISDAIIKLLIDKEYAERLGKNGLERVGKQLTWERIASRLFERL